jgi:hypothetical protein
MFGSVLTAAGIVGFYLPFEGHLDLTAAHNIIHMATGVVLLACSANEAVSAIVSRYLGMAYLLLAAAGLFVTDLFGVLTLSSMDNVIHLLIAVIALLTGFAGTKAATAGTQAKSPKRGARL